MPNPIFNGGGMIPPNNNLASLVQLITTISRQPNPIAALAAMNPRLAQQIQGKSPQEIEQFVRAEYAKRGIDINAILSQLNIF